VSFLSPGHSHEIRFVEHASIAAFRQSRTDGQTIDVVRKSYSCRQHCLHEQENLYNRRLAHTRTHAHFNRVERGLGPNSRNLHWVGLGWVTEVTLSIFYERLSIWGWVGSNAGKLAMNWVGLNFHGFGLGLKIGTHVQLCSSMTV
jgi:hypothetical protein